MLAGLSGAAAGVSVFYSILYLPFAPFSAMGHHLFWNRLHSARAHISRLLFTLAGCGRRACRPFPPAAQFGRFLAGVGISFFALGSGAVAGDSPLITASPAGGVPTIPHPACRVSNTLRRFGDEELLLRCSYGMESFREANFDVVRLISSGSTRGLGLDQAR